MNRFSNWYIQRKVIQEMQALPDHILGEAGVDRNHIHDHVKSHCVPAAIPIMENISRLLSVSCCLTPSLTCSALTD